MLVNYNTRSNASLFFRDILLLPICFYLFNNEQFRNAAEPILCIHGSECMLTVDYLFPCRTHPSLIWIWRSWMTIGASCPACVGGGGTGGAL